LGCRFVRVGTLQRLNVLVALASIMSGYTL